ncbi:MAG: hypothetical protein KatS3mg115_1700 [Candidatus Poribacteria bacterium]|nr:MAG: hypothetical protein KatS3mg115_1700 [Candidatus Poribacteria bacterium]
MGEALYPPLLRAAVRYFALRDAAELVSLAGSIVATPTDVLWEALWWRHRSPALTAGALVKAHQEQLISLPSALLERCDALLDAAQRRYMALRAVATNIAQAFANSGIAYCFLKGMALTEQVYPQIGGRVTRLFGDLDVAISSKSAGRASELLISLGFLHHGGGEDHRVFVLPVDRPLWEGLPLFERPVRLTSELEEAIRFGSRHVFLELHVGPVLGRGLLWQRRELPVDSLEGHLLHACLHYAKHLMAHSTHPTSLVDAALILNRSDFEGAVFLDLIGEDRELQRWVAVSLGGCVAAFGEEILPGSVRAVRFWQGFRAGCRLGQGVASDHPSLFQKARSFLAPDLLWLWGPFVLNGLRSLGLAWAPAGSRRRRAARWVFRRTLKPLLWEG